MSKVRYVLAVALCLTAACAKQRFATRWRLQPTLEPAVAEASEWERREIERRQEVRVLRAERAELGKILRESHSVFVDRGPGLLDSPAQTRDMKDAERRDLAVGLRRVIVLSRRINFLTGREESEDETLARAVARLREVLKRPLPDPYYGH